MTVHPTLFLLLAAPPFADLARHLEYDAGAPLEAAEKLMFERHGVRVYDISYRSPKGGRVSGFLTAPAKPAKYPAILFGHWGPGDRSEFLPEAQIYSRAGAVCLMINYPWTRHEPDYKNANDVTEPEKAIELHRQAVIDLRRGLDLLAARPDVDPTRLAYAGHSYGAQFGAMLASVDKRLKAAVLMAGIPDLGAIILEGNPPGIREYREKTGLDKLHAANEALQASAAVNYVPHAAPVPLLFQFARHEVNFTVSAMERYYRAASEPKSQLWYDTGHELNDPQALRDRARWLGLRLHFHPKP